MGTQKIGIQVYSLKDIYNQDPMKSLKIIREAGFEAVEFYGKIKMSAEELKGMLDEIGLECCGWHTPWEYTRDDILEAFVSYNKVIGNKYLVVPSLPKEYTESYDSWIKAAGRLNEIAARLGKHGMYTGMHPHEIEFNPPLNNELPWDIIAKNTCDDVILQLDTGNTFRAGTDPEVSLKKYTGRYKTIHLKPYSKEKGFSAVIGEDDINWEAIVKYAAEKGGAEYFIIEYEAENAAEHIKKCADHIKGILK